MDRFAAFLIFLFCLTAWNRPVPAKNIILETGETYQEEGLNVMCVQEKGAQPIILRECQIWDDFNKICRHEKKIHLVFDLQCIEECQHWNSFDNHCDYNTQCTYYSSQKVFITTHCEVFDSFTRSCTKTKETKISE